MASESTTATSSPVASGHHCEKGIRPTMEDEVVLVDAFELGEDTILPGVCSLYSVMDGHGGRNAAIYVRKTLQSYLTEALARPKAATEEEEEEDAAGKLTVAKALENAYKKIDVDFIEDPPDSSGTTCVTALYHHESKQLWVANAGDSRCVLCHGKEAKAMSNDHKADREDEVERIREAGGFVIYRRVMGELAVSRALGDSDFKTNDLKLVIPDPEVTEHTVTEEDRFMVLACDGLYDIVDNQTLMDMVGGMLDDGKTAEQISKDLVKFAIEDKQSRDNVSVIVVVFKH